MRRFDNKLQEATQISEMRKDLGFPGWLSLIPTPTLRSNFSCVIGSLWPFLNLQEMIFINEKRKAPRFLLQHVPMTYFISYLLWLVSPRCISLGQNSCQLSYGRNPSAEYWQFGDLNPCLSLI
jgi:hypothetical protein